MDISLLSDDELWNRTVALARAERASTYELVVHLAEMDRRHMSERRNACSLFEVCTHQLGMTEGAAYRRIRAARAIRAFPPISVLLRDGKLTVETIALLHPILDQPDAAKIVTACIGLKKWQVEAVLANRQTEKPRRDVIRFCGPVVLPAAKRQAPEPTFSFGDAVPSASSLEERRAAPTVQPPAAPSLQPPTLLRSIRVTFSADHEFHQLMRRAQQLLRHKYPDGRLEGVLKDALVALLRRKDRGFRWNA